MCTVLKHNKVYKTKLQKRDTFIFTILEKLDVDHF